MNKKTEKYFIRIALILLFIPLLLASQTNEIKIDAGTNQFVNWEKTRTIQLKGNVSPESIAVLWTCPANPKVRFYNAAESTTKVTFPRPGYYLLKLTASGTGNKKISDTVMINVFKPNSYAERLADLVNLMTVEEKIGQLVNRSGAIPRLGVAEYNYWNEALHGILDVGTTSFPQVVALGSTWDPDLVRRVATAISDEARVKNKIAGKGLSYWSPTVNIARDPRWGRNEESYSEDPYLLSRMGVAFVTGMQGNHPFYLKTVSTPKHFIANNEEIRRHSGSSDVDMRSLWEYYMPAFKQAVVEGKAFSIMCAYNELNQEPCCGNCYLLTDILRGKWGFEGYVVSDCGAIYDMISGHHLYKTGAEAAARGILAGCDLNCGDCYSSHLHEALEQGLINEKDLDRALKRVISARFRLGEFDPPGMVPYSAIPEEKLDCQAHRDLALEAAQKSIVLLKNEGILPLDKNKIKSIAVIGPNAEECQLGIYSGWPRIRISPLEGIKNKASSYGIKVNYVEGCGVGGGLLKPIETKYFAKIDDSGQKGMIGQYFNNMDLESLPVLTRLDSIINFRWGENSPAPEVPKDQFSVRWTGKIIPPETRVFSLGTRTDDGSRLYLDNKLLFEDWTDHGEKPNKVNIELKAGKEYKIVFEYYDNGLGATARLVWDLGQQDFDAAKELAKENDVVILVLGTHPLISQEENDRMDITLPEVQRELVREITQVNSNIIIVLINGGPVALSGTEKDASAIVEAWYNGQASGTAIADVLFGDVNPGGKLPETFYASTEQLPSFADYDIINHGRTYMYFEKPVLYPFGHGLSYTTFKYSNLKLSAGKIGKNGSIKIQCTVQNTGSYKGDEVVQVYVRDIRASVKVPIRQLKRFGRITLKPGEQKTVSFNLPASELSFYDIKSNDFIVEPGEFEIQVGSSSEDIRLRKTFFVE
ncbi:glycoside hydrolase family 3 C-terminal domain-containing protein [candidate division WOR-3 bacterium]|nr:glycoside hydrolase family 3 C-terminal domain-containing protein [candidate division WOR-3 bacterium]